MARSDIDPEDRDVAPLEVSQIVECPQCGAEWEQYFEAAEGIFETQELTDAPRITTECLACGNRFLVEYEGWTHHEDAG